MNNQEKIQKALNVQQNAAGLATQRYGLYLESIEAKANKMRSALEGLWQKTINSTTIGNVYDLVTGILTLVDAIGGLVPVLTLVIGGVVMLNSELIINKGLMMAATFDQWRIGLINFVTSVNLSTLSIKNFGTALTGLSATNAIVLAITAVALAIQAVNTQLIETNKLGVEANVERWKQVFDGVKDSGGGAKESLKAFKDEIERINSAVEDGGFAGNFVDRNALIGNGLRQVIEDLKLSSTSYEEYKTSATEAFQAAGYSVDEHGKVYKEMADNVFEANETTRLYVSGLEVLSAFEVQAARSANQLTDAFIEQEKAALAAKDGLFQISTQLNGLQDTAALTGEMLAKSIGSKDFNFEDVRKLTEANKDYLEFISIVDGQVVINTEGLRLYDIQKAEDAYLTMQQEMSVDGLTDAEQKQLDIMRAYIDSLRDGSAYAEQLAKAQEKLSKEREKAARDALEAEKKSAQIRLKFLQDQKKAADELLKLTIAMIKQEKQEEKEHLQEQIDNYSDLIDARIDALDALKDEEDYKRNIKKDVKKATDIKNQIAILSLDNSPEAKAKILKLQAELAEQTEKIQEKQRDHKLELEKAALQKEKEQYKAALEQKIEVIEQYLKQTGQITQDALDLINHHGDELYGRLMEWNRIYGDGIDQTIIDAWTRGKDAIANYQQLIIDINEQNILIEQLNQIDLNVTQPWKTATDAANLYLEKLKEIAANPPPAPIAPGTQYPIPPPTDPNNPTPVPRGTPPPPIGWFHEGLDVGPAGGLKTRDNDTIRAMLSPGEVVLNQQQQSNLLRNVIPNIAKTTSNLTNMGGQNINVGTLMTFNGPVDKNVLPDIEKIANKVLDKINKGNLGRGILRSSNLTSI